MNDINTIVSTLLNREPLQFTAEQYLQLSGYYSSRTILITGGGGSIGSGLIQSLLSIPCHIVAYDRSETNLMRLIALMRDADPSVRKASLTPFLGDITQPDLINLAFHTHSPELVIHAAAYKHLPLLEQFPLQAIDNNVIGTWNILNAAIFYKTPKLVLISTDKACNPTSVMGATKRLAEMIAMRPPIRHLTGPLTIAVRLGNVLGSSGSVLPLFESQIAAGGPITVTHPDATRFFMSIPEAAGLILAAAAIGQGYETFVLDMGKPVNIAAMARRLAVLRGVPDIGIQFTGLRPGEKLTEQLFTGPTISTSYPKIWQVENHINYDLIFRKWPYMIQALAKHDPDYALRCLRALVPEYAQVPLTEVSL